MPINKLQIRRFKTINDYQFELARLNLFTGMNGMGKSTCIQAILLLRQSFMHGTLLSKGLLLRGPLVDCGHGIDAYYQFSDEDDESIEFSISNDMGTRHWKFNMDADSELIPLSEDSVGREGEPVYDGAPFAGHLRYLSADRISPATSYEASHMEVNELKQLGNHGEYAIHFLAENQSKPIGIEVLRHASLGDTKLDLMSNVIAWMGEISPGVELAALQDGGIDKAVLTYEFDCGPEHRFSHPLRPTNVGFGITNVLPLIIAVLASRSGDVLIVENPESHIHPQGQAQLGMLLAMAAANGVQVVAETHSDHFLNGVRLAVKRGMIDSKETALFYFNRPISDPSHRSVIFTPKIDQDGKIDIWPGGFFDDYEKLLHELL